MRGDAHMLKASMLREYRASVDALYRDGANVRGDAHMLKASMLREYVNMSLLRHLVKLYKALLKLYNVSK